MNRQTPTSGATRRLTHTTSQGSRIRAICWHSGPDPACSSFSSCFRTNRWISVGILGRSVHLPIPQSSQPQLTPLPLPLLGPAWAHRAASPGGGEPDGNRAGDGPVGGWQDGQRMWGGCVMGMGGVGGNHLAGLPHPAHHYPPPPPCFSRGASRPPTATCPTPDPAPATTTWQPWPPRPSWVSSSCPLLSWKFAQQPPGTGGGKVKAELQLEGLRPCWIQHFLNARFRAELCRT